MNRLGCMRNESSSPISPSLVTRRRVVGKAELEGSPGAESPGSFLRRAMDQDESGGGGWIHAWALDHLKLSLDKIRSCCPADVWLTQVAQAQLQARFERLRAKHPRAAVGDLHSGLRSLSRVLSDRPPPAESIELEGAYLEAHALGRREWVLAGIGQPRLLCLLPIGGLAAATAALARATKAETTHRRRSLGRTRKGGASDAEECGRGSR
jgi:hypothetical protein